MGDQVRSALGWILEQGAIKDPGYHAAGLVTVTEVELTPDLRSARVFVSIFPDDAAPAAVDALNRAEGELKRLLADRLALRFTPKLKFIFDDSIQRGARMESILRELDDDGDPR